MKNTLSNIYYNFKSKKVKGKFLIFQSDDWGSIRMASKESYNILLKQGFNVDKCPFNKFDCIESNDDLSGLFEVLESFKDVNGNHPVFTMNFVMGNPDFKKIKDTDYKEYHWENFTETLKNYNNHDKVIDYYWEGIRKKILKPQFHGLDHLNSNSWILSLQNKDNYAIKAFEQNMFTIYKGIGSSCKKEFLDAFDLIDFSLNQNIIIEGLNEFNRFFGFKSISAMAPCYIWNEEIEKLLKKGGVKFIQSAKSQMIPVIGSDKYQIKRRFSGQTNKSGQFYITRNVVFEPSTDSSKNWVDAAMKEISNSFNFNAPAVINTHRLNFIGSLVPANRDNNLSILKELLRRVINQWPDVQFIDTIHLGELLSLN